jgi:three-Cys-motif partner protein
MIPHAPTPLPTAASHAFFKEKRSFAEVKQEILHQYFQTWCSTRFSSQVAGEALLYIDLHAGSEQEQDEAVTSPVHILEKIARSAGKKPDLNELVKTYFGDAGKGVLAELSQDLELQPWRQTLAHPPGWLHEAENQVLLSELLDAGCASLLFLNPFSYGYAQEVLLRSVTLEKADLLMLLTPDTITKAVTSKKVSPPLAELFGERLPLIRAFCQKEKQQARRQEYIVGHLLELLQEKGYLTLPFKVHDPDLDQINHFLLFCSKDAVPYRSYKEAILAYTDYQEDGVPLFEANKALQPQLSLFPQPHKYSIQNLVRDLGGCRQEYKFKSIEKISEDHSVGTHYIRENYLAAFEQLRLQGKVELLNAKTMQTIRKATFTSVVKYLAEK